MSSFGEIVVTSGIVRVGTDALCGVRRSGGLIVAGSAVEVAARCVVSKLERTSRGGAMVMGS